MSLIRRFLSYFGRLFSAQPRSTATQAREESLQAQLIGQYIGILHRYGRDSSQATAFRETHRRNAQLIWFIHRIHTVQDQVERRDAPPADHDDEPAAPRVVLPAPAETTDAELITRYLAIVGSAGVHSSAATAFRAAHASNATLKRFIVNTYRAQIRADHKLLQS